MQRRPMQRRAKASEGEPVPSWRTAAAVLAVLGMMAVAGLLAWLWPDLFGPYEGPPYRIGP